VLNNKSNLLTLILCVLCQADFCRTRRKIE